MSNTPHTYTRQCLGKWHAGFQIGNQSFVLSCFDGTEEEAEWYAKMMDKAFAAARAKDAELIQKLVDALEWVAAYDNGCPLPTWEKGYNNAWSIANSARAAAEDAGFKPTDQ